MRASIIALFILFTGTTILNAQTIQISKRTNIFGDTITTIRNGEGRELGGIKQSKDFFDNKILSFLGADGAVIYSVKRSTDIFGNNIKEVRDKHGREIRSLKNSKDFRGNRIITVYEGGRTLAELKVSKDIFGNEIKTFTGSRGERIYTIKESRDIFGDTTITLEGNADPDLVRMMLDFLKES
ncbi:MAG: hypothetical protein ACO1NU_04080 [Arcticibacter sp.]